MGIRSLTQSFLTRIGAQLTSQHVHKLNAALNYAETGRWMKAHGFNPPRFKDRTLLHSAVAEPIKRLRVCYLEFGVSEGYSLRQWAARLTHPDSQLHGFDSFEGLPESWDSLRPAGSFVASMPHYDDPRVTLHKGWFCDTLPSFRVPPHDQLIIHLDADLYSSTKYALDVLRIDIVPGTILIFDEFCDRFHELKAFDEFLSSGVQVKCLGATRNLEQVAFQIT